MEVVTRSFCLFTCVLLLGLVDEGHFWISVAGSLFLVYSPFFRFGR